VVILLKNSYAAFKIIDVSVFLFLISLKYLFQFIFYLSGGKTYQPAHVQIIAQPIFCAVRQGTVAPVVDRNAL